MSKTRRLDWFPKSSFPEWLKTFANRAIIAKLGFENYAPVAFISETLNRFALLCKSTSPLLLQILVWCRWHWLKTYFSVIQLGRGTAFSSTNIMYSTFLSLKDFMFSSILPSREWIRGRLSVSASWFAGMLCTNDSCFVGNRVIIPFVSGTCTFTL